MSADLGSSGSSGSPAAAPAPGAEAEPAVPHGPGLPGPLGGGAEEPLQAGTATGRAGEGERRAQHSGEEAWTSR